MTGMTFLLLGLAGINMKHYSKIIGNSANLLIILTRSRYFCFSIEKFYMHMVLFTTHHANLLCCDNFVSAPTRIEVKRFHNASRTENNNKIIKVVPIQIKNKDISRV